jgi:(5-formylfuran-3-yl)methyl phosphate synthase
MRLLVSVANAEDAAAALAGGADVIDAKNPLAGALGAVSADVLREIHATVAGARLVTAAIGDAADETEIERAAGRLSAAGAALVKVGFAGITSASRVEMLIKAAVRGVRASRSIRLKPDPTCDRTWGPPSGGPIKPDPIGVGFTGVIAVAYADADRVASLAASDLVDVAARAGATGVLLDTADKTGPGLRGLVTLSALVRWVAEAHEAGLLVALAGKLAAEDLAFVQDAGADIAGVRGAACEGGRRGRVSSDRVALLRTLCNPPKGGSHVRDRADLANLAEVRGIRL